MNVTVTSQQTVIQNAFENLFEEYKDMQTRPLPRYRKKKKVQSVGCGSSTGPVEASTSLPNLRGCPAKHNLPQRAMSHQGSFSSGVYSLDSDLECLPTEGDISKLDVNASQSAHRLQPGSVSGDDGSGRNADALSEAGSGFADRHGDEEAGALTESCLEEAAPVPDETEREEATRAGILTDEDILFMMHKPKFKKKRRKKPPWQKRKLDLDELWLKGQHRWSAAKEGTTGETSAKLYLNRNLRDGEVHLKKYISMMRESQRGGKRMGSGGHAATTKIAKQSTSRKGGQQMLSKQKGEQTREVPGRNKGRTKMSKKQQSKSDDLTLSSSASQDERKQANGKYRRCVKNSIHIGGSNRQSHTNINTQPRAGFKRSSTNVSASFAKDSMSRAQSKVTSDTGVGRHLDNDFTSDSGSEESLINFVSLTPRKSRKLSKRRRKSLSSVADEPSGEGARCLGTSRTSRIDAFLRSKGLLSPENTDGDDLLPTYQPLFGQSRHCGGIWNSIVEEES